MLTKKYFSISEAGNMCALPAHKLRYIDKTDKNISIIKIRGRRYYTKENLHYLVKNYSNIEQLIIEPSEEPAIPIITDERMIMQTTTQDATTIESSIIARIDQLLEKFHAILENQA
jgi:DNA-binding transcriptional MerR regulator